MPRRLRGQATWLVSRANLRAHAALQDAFAAAGSRPYWYRILAALDEAGRVSQVELGAIAEIDRSDVATSLDALGERGFTAREPDPSDRRRNVVHLTAAGRLELDRLESVLAEVQRAFLAPLTPVEQRQFVELVARLSGPRPG